MLLFYFTKLKSPNKPYYEQTASIQSSTMRKSLQHRGRIGRNKNERRPGASCFQVTCFQVIATALCGICCCIIISFAAWQFGGLGKADKADKANSLLSSTRNQENPPVDDGRIPLKIAFVGNSILFVHDCPGLLAAMLEASGEYRVTYDACMTGGATLVTLWQDLVGCTPQFSTTRRDGSMTMDLLLSEPSWDFVILNDQTRAPAFSYQYRATLRALNRTYAPRFYEAGATPIFLQTAAYRNTESIVPQLVSFEAFTDKLAQGYQGYASSMTDYFTAQQQQEISTAVTSKKHRPTEGLVAPVGQAYADLKAQNSRLYDKLYIEDDVHPSTFGTWLQACVLYVSLIDKEPPVYNPQFWNLAGSTRRRRTSYPIPTMEEGTALREAALRTMVTMVERAT